MKYDCVACDKVGCGKKIEGDDIYWIVVCHPHGDRKQIVAQDKLDLCDSCYEDVCAFIYNKERGKEMNYTFCLQLMAVMTRPFVVQAKGESPIKHKIFRRLTLNSTADGVESQVMFQSGEEDTPQKYRVTVVPIDKGEVKYG